MLHSFDYILIGNFSSKCAWQPILSHKHIPPELTLSHLLQPHIHKHLASIQFLKYILLYPWLQPPFLKGTPIKSLQEIMADLGLARKTLI